MTRTCNQCQEQMEHFVMVCDMRLTLFPLTDNPGYYDNHPLLCVCSNPECPDYALVQIPLELMPKKEIEVCGRCYEEVDVVYPANCKEKPELLKGVPMGMYHCSDCGAMLIAGIEHFDLCKQCLDRKHPRFDK